MHINAPMTYSLNALHMHILLYIKHIILNLMEINNYADLMLSHFGELCKLFRRVGSRLVV